MDTAIRTAIFPVGGLGTRFLPATKAMPKEMLPVVDKPLIQYAVEEARAEGAFILDTPGSPRVLQAREVQGLLAQVVAQRGGSGAGC